MKPPRIFLGDRAFLKKYGSVYSIKEAAEICDMVVRSSALGLASGDHATAEIAERALAAHRARRIHHSAMLIRVRDLSSSSPGYVSNLSIQENLAYFSLSSSLEIEADSDQVESEQFIIEKFRPGFISVGGDWLDILLVQQRVDLAHEIFYKILKTIRRVGGEPILLSFVVAPTILEFLREHRFYGLLAPVNLLDRSREAVLTLAREECYIFALHILANGRVPLLPALDYALNHVQVYSCIVGARSLPQICQLIAYSERFRAP